MNLLPKITFDVVVCADHRFTALHTQKSTSQISIDSKFELQGPSHSAQIILNQPKFKTNIQLRGVPSTDNFTLLGLIGAALRDRLRGGQSSGGVDSLDLKGNSSIGDAGPAQSNLDIPPECGKSWLNKVAQLFRLAADQGDATAKRYLGMCYKHGECGLIKNETEAVRLYCLAADQGDPIAQRCVGVCYEYGIGGLRENETEAVRLYRLAADQGDARAQRYLGQARRVLRVCARWVGAE